MIINLIYFKVKVKTILLKNILLKGFSTLLLLAAFNIAEGQDVHYSQWEAAPLFINPALTGNASCNWRTGVNHRTQARYTIPFETYNAFIDTRIKPRFVGQRGWIGIGTNLYYDNAGDGPLKKIQAMLFTSYSLGFNADNTIYASMGVGVGITNRQINYNFIFGNQWDAAILGFDASLASGEGFPNSSIFYPDFNYGLHFHHLVNQNFAYNLGASLSHINKPIESFFASGTHRLQRKLITYARTSIKIGTQMIVNPSAYFLYQNKVNQLLFGSNLDYKQAYLTISAGLWYRYGRDIIPLIGMGYKDFKLKLTYDINVSKQHAASEYKGGFEITLIKTFCTQRREKTCRDLKFN